MDAKEKVKADILSWFRETHADVGHVFNERAFMARFFINYNPREKAAYYDEALSELAGEGIVEEMGGRRLLTQKGLNLIYPESPAEAKEKAKSDILSWFREIQADVGHPFNERAFMTRYFMNDNPKEKGVILEALSELVTGGLLEKRDDIFVLAKRGSDTIYRGKESGSG